MQATSEPSNQRKPNRLSREKSPYLLQHQHNPVDWYAWGAEAFEKARREDKPIFLSIGYSTCHWCHVMERESFENETIAAYLNEHFVSIKLDREERPDVDKIYMTFVQATTGSGGWPLNVFLTPDLKPFFGGTYFPPDNRHGRGAFLDVLKQVQAAWTSRRDDLTNSAVRMHEHLVQATGSIHAPQAVPGEDALTHAGDVLKQGYDPHHGGFGQAPKFPQPSHPQFLLRFAKRFKDEQAKRMVLYTCDQMAAGGIHDQLGGGFSRYSVDAEWLVPHFEKMLYDNAQLACLYLDAYQIGGSPACADVARDILDYVVRDMRHPEGGFFSAEDADSEGHEGKFYCWTRAEMAEVLAPPELQIAEQYFGITDQGNFVDHSHPTPLRGQNVLSVVRPELAASSSALLRSAKEKLLAARSARVRPHLDDKVLASWNGLMLAAFSRGSVVLGESKFAAAAEQCARFMRQRLWDEGTKTLYHRWREGERDRVELLEGYAFLALGMVELYEATLSPGHLEFALELADGMVTRFYDPENGGFWQSPKDCTDLILRVKEDYDGAEPSGNSVATMALLKLASICARPDLREAAEKTLSLFAARLEQVPQAMPFMLQALDFSLQEPFRVVVTGNQNQTEGLLRSIHSVYQPNKVVLGSVGMVDPFARALKTAAEPLAYICTGSECRPPTSDPKELKASLV